MESIELAAPAWYSCPPFRSTSSFPLARTSTREGMIYALVTKGRSRTTLRWTSVQLTPRKNCGGMRVRKRSANLHQTQAAVERSCVVRAKQSPPYPNGADCEGSNLIPVNISRPSRPTSSPFLENHSPHSSPYKSTWSPCAESVASSSTSSLSCAHRGETGCGPEAEQRATSNRRRTALLLLLLAQR